MQRFNSYLNYLAATLLFLTVLGILYLSIIHLKKEPLPQRIVIEYALRDSVVAYGKGSIKSLDSLIKETKEISNIIQGLQSQQIRKIEDKDFFNKFYTVVIAIIIAIAGFFGFKNISEIKQRAIDETSAEAERTAREVSEGIAKEVSDREFEKFFTDEYRSKIFDIATKSFSQEIDKFGNSLKGQIEQLEDRIFKLELMNNTEETRQAPEVPEDTADFAVSPDETTIQSKRVKPKNPFENE